MKKLFNIIIVCVLILCTLMIGCKQETQTNKPTTQKDKNGYFADETINIVYAYEEVFSEAPDKERVLNRLNEITKERINVTVTMETYPHSSMVSSIDFKLASKQQIDLFTNSRLFASLAVRNALAPLDDLIKQYGNDMLYNGEKGLMKFNEVTYGIACNDADFGYPCLLVNEEMAKKFGVEDKIKKVKRFEDMEEIYEIVQKKDPSIKCYLPNGYSNSAFSTYRVADGINNLSFLGDGLGVILNNDNYNIVNLFETPEYVKLLDMSRRFHQKGLFSSDAVIFDVNRDLQYQSGEGFSAMNNHRALKHDEPYLVNGNEFFGIDSWVIPLSDMFIDTRRFGVSISAESEYKEAAMAWLNLITTDKEIYQLLAYGIEGEHYIRNENGTVSLPDGYSSVAETGYETSHYFTIGDIRNRLVWDTVSDDPDYYLKLVKQSSNAVYSNTFGFVYDNSAVSNEVAACNKVVQKYAMALETGSLDPKTELPKFLKELKDAGIDKIIKEKQQQLEVWRKKTEGDKQ